MKLCIKNLADQNGYTKIKLAKELNMSRQYIYSLYDGSVKSIKIENIEKLCEIFHCTPNDLFINDEPDEPSEEDKMLKLILTNGRQPRLKELTAKEPDPYQITTLPDTKNIIDELLSSNILRAYVDGKIEKLFDEKINNKDDTK